ncbi:hypothetical protein [Derxia gummosa]|uniref:Uncharacterized protein n=1 Tax=Derxia gummosa DSM 723 TaxID=1121388 RepID=A0A8B6XC21_9BURK|nr:hypothetical protein [Derxia gummosa]
MSLSLDNPTGAAALPARDRAGKPFADAPPQHYIEAWRAQWWNPEPPGLSRALEGLPIFLGSDDAVRGWAEALCNLCGSIEAHINDNCRGRVPRWMKLPKVLFGVERVTVVRCEAKDSRSFTNVADFVASVRTTVEVADQERLSDWLRAHPEGKLVSHAPFVDLAAHVYSRHDDKPRRVRFYEGGLVLAAAPGLERVAVDDHRGIVRKLRSNRYVNPLLELGKMRVYGVEQQMTFRGR